MSWMKKWLLQLFALFALASFCFAGTPRSAVAGDVSRVPVADKAPAVQVVTKDGLMLELRRRVLIRMVGPGLAGELRVIGSVVEGLLSVADQRQLRQRFPEAFPPVSAGKIRKALVLIDPGHGGKEKGAVGVSGMLEKDLVLAISKRIHRRLLSLGDVRVVMTRETDEHVDLWDRVEMANKIKVDLFISVHANAFVRPSLGGVETFFHSVDASDEEARRVARAENAAQRREVDRSVDPLSSILADMQRAETLRNSSRFAHLVQEQLAGILPFDNLGVRQADFVVLRGTRMPSVLLELGFMTNKREERILKQEKVQEEIAAAVVKSVAEFVRLMRLKNASTIESSEGGKP